MDIEKEKEKMQKILDNSQDFAMTTQENVIEQQVMLTFANALTIMNSRLIQTMLDEEGKQFYNDSVKQVLQMLGETLKMMNHPPEISTLYVRYVDSITENIHKQLGLK